MVGHRLRGFRVGDEARRDPEAGLSLNRIVGLSGESGRGEGERGREGEDGLAEVHLVDGRLVFLFIRVNLCVDSEGISKIY